MNEAEKEVFERIEADFLKIKKKKKLTVADNGQLNTDITGMLGMFALRPDLTVAEKIEEMTSFGEKNLWAMHGHRIEFDRLKKKHKIK